MSEQNGISYLTPPRPVSEIQQEARRSTSAQAVAEIMFVKMAQEQQTSFPATAETTAIITTATRASPRPSIYLYLSKKAFIFSP